MHSDPEIVEATHDFFTALPAVLPLAADAGALGALQDSHQGPALPARVQRARTLEARREAARKISDARWQRRLARDEGRRRAYAWRFAAGLELLSKLPSPSHRLAREGWARLKWPGGDPQAFAVLLAPPERDQGPQAVVDRAYACPSCRQVCGECTLLYVTHDPLETEKGCAFHFYLSCPEWEAMDAAACLEHARLSGLEP